MLGIIFLLPIPLGANRPWAWSFFEITIFALTTFVVIQNWKIEKLGLNSYLSSIYLWLTLILIALLQITPLPDFVVALLSPTSFDLFYSVSAQSYYISVDPGQSMITFIKLLSYFCLYFCVLALVNTEKKIRLLLLTIMTAGAFQAIYGVLEVLFSSGTSLIFGMPVDEAATGSFVYKHHYANFLMISLAAAAGLLVTSLEKYGVSISDDSKRSLETFLLDSKGFLYTCIAIMIIGLMMSRSGMGNSAFYSAMAIVGIISFVLLKKRSKGLTILVISMFIIDLLIVSAYFGLARVKERLAQTALPQDSHDEVVKDAYPIISDFPIFGSGGGSFYSTFPSYQQSEVSYFYDHLQNDYLQFLIEYGVIGSFVLFSIFVFCIYKAMRAMHKRQNSIFKGSAYACLVVFLGMGLHMAVDFPLQTYANASYFVVFLALSMIINSLKIRRPNKSLRTA